MRISRIAFVCSLLVCSYKISGQNNCIKIAPLNFVWGNIPFTNEINAGYERSLCGNSSISAHLAFISPYNSYEGRYKVITSGGEGLRSQLMYRYYFAPKGNLRGFYGAVHVSYAYLNIKYADRPQTAVVQKGTADALIGYQFITRHNWAFDLFMGSGARSKRLNVPAGYPDPSQAMLFGSFNALRLVGGINIGYAF